LCLAPALRMLQGQAQGTAPTGHRDVRRSTLMFDTSKIGQSFPPFTIEVERCKIHELALAIGDDNPIYHSREAAQAAGYKDVPLSPTAPTMFSFWGNTRLGSQLMS